MAAIHAQSGPKIPSIKNKNACRRAKDLRQWKTTLLQEPGLLPRVYPVPLPQVIKNVIAESVASPQSCVFKGAEPVKKRSRWGADAAGSDAPAGAMVAAPAPISIGGGAQSAVAAAMALAMGGAPGGGGGGMSTPSAPKLSASAAVAAAMMIGSRPPKVSRLDCTFRVVVLIKQPHAPHFVVVTRFYFPPNPFFHACNRKRKRFTFPRAQSLATLTFGSSSLALEA